MSSHEPIIKAEQSKEVLYWPSWKGVECGHIQRPRPQTEFHTIPLLFFIHFMAVVREPFKELIH